MCIGTINIIVETKYIPDFFDFFGTQYKASEKNIGDDGTKKTNAAKHC